MNLGELLRNGRDMIKERKVSKESSEAKIITDPLILKWMDNIKIIRNENKI